MLEQEGAKPHLTIVPTADENPNTYTDMLIEMVGNLSKQKATGTKPDIAGALKHLDPQEDNSMVRDWVADNGIMTKPGFDKLLARVARDRKLEEEIGFVPQDVMDLVVRYAAKHKLKPTTKGTLNRSKSVTVGDMTINASNCDTSPEVRLLYDVANAGSENLDTYARELRLLVDRLGLPFRDSVIADAITVWHENEVIALKQEAISSIQFQRGKATGPEGQAMWAAMEKACFNTQDIASGFPIAVIKKFMWQVKRKARNMPVTNHLMPVLTGQQGKGKTQFVKAMTAPLADMLSEVDFQMLTDGKTADIWDSLILFIDEMGYFKMADVDAVKNVITSEHRTIRTMRSNHSSKIKNQATLIGCTNKSLGQLIRDETGGRRFAELLWSSTPDWTASNAIDWKMLWQSVDETAADPIIAAGMMDLLREQQEDNRNASPVEIWARSDGSAFKDWTKASSLHIAYREWEKDAFPRADSSQTHFGRTLTNLINSDATFPMEKDSNRNGVVYRYYENRGQL